MKMHGKQTRAEYMRKWLAGLTPEKRKKHLEGQRASHKKYKKTELGKATDRAKTRRFRYRLRDEVFAHYGGYCVCCMENEVEFLTIDHIIPVRKRFGARRSGTPLYVWLKRNDYPEGFQILCYNCNLAKRAGGECPHRSLVMKRFTLYRGGGSHA